MKKGFLGGGGSPKPKEPKITELKSAKNSNPLQIKEVQDAMKMNTYLEDTRSQWMTENFLTQVTTNPKISKLFTNPEYMKAVDMFKTNPKEAMARYGNNQEFMEAFKEFCKVMGMQLQSTAQVAQ
jgi:ABC-type metal ion transport system substrate-binding protein